MFICIGNDLGDRMKASEMKNSLLRKYSDYQQVVHEISHMPDL